MKFQRELASYALFNEMMPLFDLHYQTIAHYQDIELDPDFKQYLKIEELGMLRIFTARDEAGTLLGYAWFFVRANLHYRNSKQASQDILFIDPKKRGFGLKFILWCDLQVKMEGCQVVYQHVKTKHDFGKLLERIGYTLVDHIYGRRLDKEGI